MSRQEFRSKVMLNMDLNSNGFGVTFGTRMSILFPKQTGIWELTAAQREVIMGYRALVEETRADFLDKGKKDDPAEKGTASMGKESAKGRKMQPSGNAHRVKPPRRLSIAEMQAKQVERFGGKEISPAESDELSSE